MAEAGAQSTHCRVFCSPNQVAEKVASRIAEGFSDTALIMVSPSWVRWCSQLPGRLLSVLSLTWSWSPEPSSVQALRQPSAALCGLLPLQSQAC